MKEFDPDRKEVIERARAAGIEAMITVGSDLEGTVSAMKLAGEYDFIYASIGIHPHDAKDFSDDIYIKLRNGPTSSRVVAIGETGLDYHYDHSPRRSAESSIRKTPPACRRNRSACHHSQQGGPERYSRHIKKIRNKQGCAALLFRKHGNGGAGHVHGLLYIYSRTCDI